MTKRKTGNNKNDIKKEHNKIERNIEEKSSIKDTVKLVVVILVILLVFYLLTVFILNKKTFVVNENVNIEYTKILAGVSFKQKEKDYLVFYYNSTDSEASNYADLVSSYREKDKHLTIYTVDLNEGMNKKYVSDEEKLDTDSVKDLRVSKATIIRFKDNKISDYTTSSFSEYLDNNVE